MIYNRMKDNILHAKIGTRKGRSEGILRVEARTVVLRTLGMGPALASCAGWQLAFATSSLDTLSSLMHNLDRSNKGLECLGEF